MKASFTIEASFLMVLIVPVLAGIIYMGLYLHGIVWMRNTAYETVICGSLGEWDEASREQMLACRDNRLEGGLIGVGQVMGVISVDKKKFSASYCGIFAVPQARITQSAELSVVKPAGMILKMKNINEIMKGDQ